jgi:hypothetical protein
MPIVVDYTSDFFQPSPLAEKVGTLSVFLNQVTILLRTGNVFVHSISNSSTYTYTFSQPPSSDTAYGFTLIVANGAGTPTLSWPSSVDWAGGTAPTAPAANETDIFCFFTRDGGTTYYGFQAGDAMA